MFEKDPVKESLRKIIEDNAKKKKDDEKKKGFRYKFKNWFVQAKHPCNKEVKEKGERLEIILEQSQTFPNSKHDDFLDSISYVITDTRWTWKFIFNPYKFWVGVELDREYKTIYVLLLPMLGIKIYKETLIVSNTIGV